jgi:hypothetical protein
MLGGNLTQLAKKSIAIKLAHNRALMDVLQIHPGPHEPGCLQGQELEQHIQEVYNAFVTQHHLDSSGNEPQKAALLQEIATQEKHRGSFLIYHPEHALRWQGKIEGTPLHEIGIMIEKSLVLFSYEMSTHYGVEGLTTQDLRHLARILREGVYQRRKQKEDLSETEERIARLQAAIAELQDHEQLATKPKHSYTKAADNGTTLHESHLAIVAAKMFGKAYLRKALQLLVWIACLLAQDC